MKRIILYFHIRKQKDRKDKTVPVYVRVSIEGDKPFVLSLKHNVNPGDWNNAAQQLNGKSESVKIFNNYLQTVRRQIHDAFDAMLREDIPVSSQLLKDRLQPDKAEQKKRKEGKFLVEVFKEHNAKIKALAGVDYSPQTWERYETSLRHTQSFLKHRYNADDILVADIDLAFINDFDFYLRTEKKIGNNSTVKYIKNFGKIVRICLAHGWITKDPFANYKMKVKEVIREFLNEEELAALQRKEFASERLSQVRDIFLFSCYTGLAYADVHKLKTTEIVKHFDGEDWILTSRQKTKTESRVPLLPDATQIIEKYEDHPVRKEKGLLLPVLSNQKMNDYLKEIAVCCGIQKELTYHIARHTFATTVTLSNGVPIESVSKMLGHKNLRTTQHYAKILDSKVSNDMAALRNVMQRKAVN